MMTFEEFIQGRDFVTEVDGLPRWMQNAIAREVSDIWSMAVSWLGCCPINCECSEEPWGARYVKEMQPVLKRLREACIRRLFNPGRCETCTHWERAAGSKHNKCSHEAMQGDSDGQAAIRGEIRTGPRFSCIHYKRGE